MNTCETPLSAHPLPFTRMQRLVFSLLLAPFILFAAETRYQPKAQVVTDNVYALIGPLDQRSESNDGLNNNQAFIIGRDGVLLIDSGASQLGAEAIARAVKAVTPLPVKWVINTGSQDHRWLGNDYFAARGAEIIALQHTVQTQQNMAAQQLDSLRSFLGARLDGTQPRHAARPPSGDNITIERGGIKLTLHYTDAHFPGDAWVWLPQTSVLFSGDLVYVDRLLAVLPNSSVVKAQQAYQRMEQLNPQYIVPGHGRVTNAATARRECGDYYDFLVNTIGVAARNMDAMDEVLDSYNTLSQFEHLQHFRDLHRANMNRTYLEFEQQ